MDRLASGASAPERAAPAFEHDLPLKRIEKKLVGDLGQDAKRLQRNPLDVTQLRVFLEPHRVDLL